MMEKSALEGRYHKILENNGGEIADKARNLLLLDPALKSLHEPLEFISKTWRDLTPALISLSCKAVGGKKEHTCDMSLAMCLMHLSFYLWDDMLDNTRQKQLKPTLLGKFGGNISLVVGGIASAKAFSIINNLSIENDMRMTINKLVWELWTKMAKAETDADSSRNQTNKLGKMTLEAADTETCFRVGGVLGKGNQDEIDHLGQCGLNLGLIFALWNDFHVSTNLTVELADKIISGKLPYTLLWACDRSENLQRRIQTLAGKKTIPQTQIKYIVKEILSVDAFENALQKIKLHAKLATAALNALEKGTATKELTSLVSFQPELFVESLSDIQAQKS